MTAVTGEVDSSFEVGLVIAPQAGGSVRSLSFPQQLIFNRVEGRHLGVEVVQVVEGDGFGRHGTFERSVFKQAMMTGDNMLQLEQEVLREIRQGAGLLFHHEQPYADVPNELAFVGIAEVFAEGELFAFSDVMKDAARQ